jgi:hypothetical protein
MLHRIRLARPWVLKDQTDQGISVERRFQRPSGLEPGEFVDLVIRCQPGVSLVGCHMNGRQLFPQLCGDWFWRQALTPDLESSNLVHLKIKFPVPARDVFKADKASTAASRPDWQMTTANKGRFDIAPWADVWLEIDGNPSE